MTFSPLTPDEMAVIPKDSSDLNKRMNELRLQPKIINEKLRMIVLEEFMQSHHAFIRRYRFRKNLIPMYVIFGGFISVLTFFLVVVTENVTMSAAFIKILILFGSGAAICLILFLISLLRVKKAKWWLGYPLCQDSCTPTLREF
jgi:hypothetical protein